ncbi:hypothetical protein HPP92_023711 [Vanilla planifolia]|uniref:VQ domain-containing protein n=1 Tax=Vanilla planifolia TaxID=51239 RepID=A0A835PNE7_VANPL|nr:hypothetical protein HPP92_023711 [Vanilla planifolia]
MILAVDFSAHTRVYFSPPRSPPSAKILPFPPPPKKIPSLRASSFDRSMETPPNHQERENPSLVASSSASSAGSNAAAVPPLTPRSAQRQIDPGSYPTTFVQADTSSFKQVVQMLTGSAETAAAAAVAPPVSPRSPPPPGASTAKNMIPPTGKSTGPKKQAFKLYERRGSLRNLKAISPLMPSFAAAFSPRKQAEMLSPSTLDFPL